MTTTEMDFVSPRGTKCIVNFKRSDPIYCFSFGALALFISLCGSIVSIRLERGLILWGLPSELEHDLKWGYYN